MYKKILIAIDGSELAEKAITHGVSLAKATGSPVVIATVTELWSALDMAHKSKVGVADPIKEYEIAAAENAKKILASAETQAKNAGISPEYLHIKDKHPAEGIISTATSNGCDIIVMSSHGRRGVQKVLLGSVASEVLTHSKIPVLIVKQP
jgi:nucleotide-binding universal stress UspA family protein